MAVVLLVSALAAFGQFLLHGDLFRQAEPKHPNVQWIGGNEAARLDRALWIDARSRELYEKAHPKDALRLNLEEWDLLLPVFLDRWEPGIPLVVYCAPGSCDSSLAIAERLAEALPNEKIFVLKGGWVPPGAEKP